MGRLDPAEIDRRETGRALKLVRNGLVETDPEEPNMHVVTGGSGAHYVAAGICSCRGYEFRDRCLNRRARVSSYGDLVKGVKSVT